MDVSLEVEDAWRGRCSRHGWPELTNYTRMLWALIALTFTFYLYLYLWMMLHIVNNESWSMEDGVQRQMLQLTMCRALFYFKKTAKCKKNIKKFLERDIEKYALLCWFVFGYLYWCELPKLWEKGMRSANDSPGILLAPRILHLPHIKGLHLHRYFQIFSKPCMHLWIPPISLQFFCGYVGQFCFDVIPSSRILPPFLTEPICGSE